MGAGIAAAAAVVAGILAVRALRRQITIVAVFGPSMQPALRAGDRVLVRRVQIGQLRPGQIIVVEKPGQDGRWMPDPPRWPADSREWLIKRVAAVPGNLRPSTIAPPVSTAGPLVPAGQLAVLGDNEAMSLDSRVFGYIPAERLLGVMVRPLGQMSRR